MKNSIYPNEVGLTIPKTKNYARIKHFYAGGFWKFTPDSLIKEIGKSSLDPNFQIGKIKINEDRLGQDIQAEGVKGKMEFISKGGLCVLMRRYKSLCQFFKKLPRRVGQENC